MYVKVMNKMFFRSSKRPPVANTDSGLTLIECLVAIMVISLTSASISPVLVLSVATRVQNQKSEQALQLARGEIDRVRLLVESKSIYTDADLRLAEDEKTKSGAVSAPDTSILEKTWLTDSPRVKTARIVDTNGDDVPDFVIQSFRGKSPIVATAEGNMPVAFDMGVRVYDATVLKSPNGGGFKTELEKKAASLGFTSGEGERGRSPLAVVYSQIVNSDRAESLCKYMEYLGEDPADTSKFPTVSCAL